MALVKFIEENRRDAAQFRILNQLPEQNAFGHETNAGALRRDVLEPNLISDFVAKPAIPLEGNARGEKTRRETARLQDYDLAVAEQSVIEQNLRDLGGFSGAGRGLDDEAGVFVEFGY